MQWKNAYIKKKKEKKARPFVPQGTRNAEHAKSKVSKRKEITKIRVKTSEIEKVNQRKGRTLEKESKMEEKIAKFIEIREKSQINNTISGRRDMTIDTTEKPRIIRNYYEQYTSLPHPSKKSNDLEEIVKFLKHNTLQRLNDEKIENLNRQNTSKDNESVIRSSPTR